MSNTQDISTQISDEVLDEPWQRAFNCAVSSGACVCGACTGTCTTCGISDEVRDAPEQHAAVCLIPPSSLPSTSSDETLEPASV